MPRSRLAVKAGQLVILDEARVRDLDDQGKEVLAHYLPTTGGVLSHPESHSDMMVRSDEDSSTNEKPIVSKGFDASGLPESGSDVNAPRRTRTYNPLIKSQLLCQLS